MKTKDEIAKIYYQASKDYGKGMRDVINSLRAQGKTEWSGSRIGGGLSNGLV